MKKAIGRVLLSPNFQASIWGDLARALVRATRSLYRYSPRFLADIQATDRPHYAYCLLQAADLARRLGQPRISAIEFGVAGGNGLIAMRDFARDIARTTGVAIDCYGFDSGQGMPAPDGAKDLPYWFRAAQYRMDENRLRMRLGEAKLVIGDIRDTIGDFVDRHDPAPIGAIFNDTDYWSSTAASFALFDAAAQRPQAFLPRLFLYFDDIIGSATEMYGPFNGQLAAIKEFNGLHEDMKIHLNQNLLPQHHLRWRYQIYYAHLFSHPDYDRYIGGGQQDAMEEALTLKP